MSVFVLMTRLSADAMSDPGRRRAMGREWLGHVKATCPGVKFLAHYALLGRYDFMDIFEAPDVETAHKVSLVSRAEGAVMAESWQALPYEEFLKVMEQVAD